MLLYHYNRAPLQVLKTTEVRGVVSDEQRKLALELTELGIDIAPYYQHISFFFDPIPADILGWLFSKHPKASWRTGDIYYEHVIDTTSINELKYRITETSVMAPITLEWPGKDASIDKKKTYFKRRYELELKAGFVGFSNNTLEKSSKQFIGKTREAFIHAAFNPFTPNSLTQYAADVPHVMLYPAGGIVNIVKPPKKIRIGDGNVSTESTALAKPPSSRW